MFETDTEGKDEVEFYLLYACEVRTAVRHRGGGPEDTRPKAWVDEDACPSYAVRRRGAGPGRSGGDFKATGNDDLNFIGGEVRVHKPVHTINEFPQRRK